MPRFCGRTLPPGLKRQMVTTIRGIECGMGNGDLFCALWFFGYGEREREREREEKKKKKRRNNRGYRESSYREDENERRPFSLLQS